MIKRAICYLLALLCAGGALYMIAFVMFNSISRAVFIAVLFILGACTLGFVILGDKLAEIEEEDYKDE